MRAGAPLVERAPPSNVPEPPSATAIIDPAADDKCAVPLSWTVTAAPRPRDRPTWSANNANGRRRRTVHRPLPSATERPRPPPAAGGGNDRDPSPPSAAARPARGGGGGRDGGRGVASHARDAATEGGAGGAEEDRVLEQGGVLQGAETGG